jgi:hypothetical protein
MSSSGALFEPGEGSESFPTEPAFVVPVEVRAVPEYGEGQKGVFALAPIPANTKFWIWTDRVLQIPAAELEEYLERETATITSSDEQFGAKQILLRQGFVLPSQDTVFCSNPTDAGRFMNHSNTPNCGPDGTLREIVAGGKKEKSYCICVNSSFLSSLFSNKMCDLQRGDDNGLFVSRKSAMVPRYL